MSDDVIYSTQFCIMYINRAVLIRKSLQPKGYTRKRRTIFEHNDARTQRKSTASRHKHASLSLSRGVSHPQGHMGKSLTLPPLTSYTNGQPNFKSKWQRSSNANTPNLEQKQLIFRQCSPFSVCPACCFPSGPRLHILGSSRQI